MARRKIQTATREVLRLANEGVGKSFLKTITELTTNADSALKDQACVAHASGLVELLLDLKVGDFVETSQLKKKIPHASTRKIVIQVYATSTHGMPGRTCRVIDAGPGMTEQELDQKFGEYASAKAKGKQTRSLFGRGALDVFLFHDEAEILSVANGVLSRCQFYRDSCECDPMEIGPVNEKLLKKYRLPDYLKLSGTVAQFRVRDKVARIPQQAELSAKASSFYMLRLIAADPNTEVIVEQYRTSGHQADRLVYDFPVGQVVLRAKDRLHCEDGSVLAVDMLVARAEDPLPSHPSSREKRQNGLLFVDENDAVLDLTLMPGYDNVPYLKHIYGVVRITGIRKILEDKLEASPPEAVLAATRDGFVTTKEFTKRLFKLVEKHVGPVYEKEEKRQKRGLGNRSEELAKRVKDALKAINDFTTEETGEDDGVGPEPAEKNDAIYFGMDKTRLHVDRPRKVTLYVNLKKVKKGEGVFFMTDNDEIKVDPDSEEVKGRKNSTRQKIPVTLNCSLSGQSGTVKAETLDKDGNEVSAGLKILNVEEPPVYVPPEDIEFSAPRFSGTPNKVQRATLRVNLDKFTGMPKIIFWLEKHQASVSLGEAREDRYEVKVESAHIVVPDHRVAQVSAPFYGTAWGQSGILRAKAKLSDGKIAEAKCRLVFQRPPGDEKFTDFLYEELDRNVLADVARDKIYVNGKYPLHHKIFGRSQEDFDKALEENPIAQLRTAQIVVEAAVYDAAAVKLRATGGMLIDMDDPIGSTRTYIEERRMKLEPRVIQALAAAAISKD
ncbi:hypothetical protein LCGC14_0124390 [marine sediment metagenome]|uniref:Histidine kinase/HSP90-like ATPase domain-containing protein n=1 Tax=marine sediment metagenome TaxID=412755 RepID=A0A0F9V9I1_9ZZZZ|nr:hypothetical protein [Phycisphaerae bacterium]HDZ42339.1 hypothetical protein [Phycisphaerae bacterium]